jgi:predicted nucleic acid-binding protein
VKNRDVPVYTLDTSVLTKFFLLDEEYVSAAQQLSAAFDRYEIDVAAPEVALYETASSILKAVRRGRLSDEAARVALVALFDLELQVVGGAEERRDVLLRAYPVARELGRSVYDATFLVVSATLDAPLITADRPLFEAARSNFDVIWLPNLALP